VHSPAVDPLYQPREQFVQPPDFTKLYLPGRHLKHVSRTSLLNLPASQRVQFAEATRSAIVPGLQKEQFANSMPL
jgi:hypothetical protein